MGTEVGEVPAYSAPGWFQLFPEAAWGTSPSSPLITPVPSPRHCNTHLSSGDRTLALLPKGVLSPDKTRKKAAE